MFTHTHPQRHTQTHTDTHTQTHRHTHTHTHTHALIHTGRERTDTNDRAKSGYSVPAVWLELLLSVSWHFFR